MDELWMEIIQICMARGKNAAIAALESRGLTHEEAVRNVNGAIKIYRGDYLNDQLHG